ncbi:uncharacterized protein LOC124922501 [Impatiens glandulifera]|uniref:uncharacterized protein LOC124922501 n=1 Tax=Impatiens glandulifera TaxID=253017 RepID=UPI001FB05FEF|nr:uncharacterized protein LOC124922501 [Impatiens glandulifera]
MDELNGGRSKAWEIYNGSEPSSSQVAKEEPWNSFGGSNSSSMHAISFGFVATAILISMFLMIAILEHLFRPNNSPFADNSSPNGSSISNDHRSLSMEKLRNLKPVSTPAEYAKEISVMMPGQQYPTYIAHPSPLIPCTRETVLWPSHDQHH